MEDLCFQRREGVLIIVDDHVFEEYKRTKDFEKKHVLKYYVLWRHLDGRRIYSVFSASAHNAYVVHGLDAYQRKRVFELPQLDFREARHVLDRSARCQQPQGLVGQPALQPGPLPGTCSCGSTAACLLLPSFPFYSSPILDCTKKSVLQSSRTRTFWWSRQTFN